MTKDQIPQMQLVEAKAEPSVALMLHGLLESVQKGETTPQTVEVLKGMMDLYERNEARRAEKEFAVAFNQLMSEMPFISATKPVPNKDGTTRYKYAPLDEIEPKVRPVALRNGFSYSFAEGKSDAGTVSKILTIQHKGGHYRSNMFTVRRSTPPNANDSQADGNTHSYAKRGAFCDGFGIVVEHDDDARMIGKPIGKALADDLEERVKACGADEEAFLKYAGAKNYAEISDERWPMLDELLKRKEAAKTAREKLSPEGEWK